MRLFVAGRRLVDGNGGRLRRADAGRDRDRDGAADLDGLVGDADADTDPDRLVEAFESGRTGCARFAKENECFRFSNSLAFSPYYALKFG